MVKADGLAAGKGVIICDSRSAAAEAAQGLFTGALLGSAEQQVVVEEFLEGDEISFLCLSDGKHVAPLVPAQDHKRIGEGDTGPNTGGMGVYSTDSLLDPAMSEWILHHIAEPTIAGMAEEETPFTGVLYCGLMMTARGPQVLEFNARFGDPETQAILVRLESDLVDALEALRRRPPRRNAAALVARRLCVRRGQLRRLSRQLQKRIADHRPCSCGPGSRRAGLPCRHGADGRPNRYSRRPRSRRHRCCRLARSGSRPRLPGHGRDFILKECITAATSGTAPSSCKMIRLSLESGHLIRGSHERRNHFRRNAGLE